MSRRVAFRVARRTVATPATAHTGTAVMHSIRRSPRAHLTVLAAAVATTAAVAACSTAPTQRAATPPQAQAQPVSSGPASPALTSPAPASSEPATPVPTIEPADLEPRLADRRRAPFVLDVRTPDEYAAGHLPGARLIPHDEVERRLGELDPARGEEIVVYCRSGRRAALAIETLQRAGFTRVSHLAGDYQRWSAEGRSVIAPASAPAPTSPSATPAAASP